MIGKVWKGSKKVLAYALALVMVVGVMQAVSPVRAAGWHGESSGITFKPTAYDITTKKLTVEISTNKTDENHYLAYCEWLPQNAEYDTPEKCFGKATKTQAHSVSVSVSDNYAVRYYVWYINKEGTKTNTDKDYDEFFLEGMNVLLNKAAKESVNVNYIGNSLADYKLNPKIENGVVTWDTTHTGLSGVYLNYYDGDSSNDNFSEIGGNYKDASGKCDGIKIQRYLNASGTYTYYVRAEGTNMRTKPYVLTYKYVKPKTRLPRVTNVKWVEGKTGVISFTPLEDYSKVLYYQVDLVDKSGFRHHGATLDAEWLNLYFTNTGKTEWNVSGNMMQGREYTDIRIRTISNDIEHFANSNDAYIGSDNEPEPEEPDVEEPPVEPEKPPVQPEKPNVTEQVNAANDAIVNALSANNVSGITASTSAETLKTKLNEITDANTKKTVVAAVVNALVPTDSDNQDLKKAMQNDSALLAKIGVLEEVIGKKATPNVDTTAQELFDGTNIASSINVVGAGLNVESDTAPQLQMNVPTGLDLEEYGDNSVALDISLKNDEEAVTTLKIPVTITMPVPKAIQNKNKLIIKHKGQNSPEETLRNGTDFSIDGGNVTFTVTHFSTFIFAEEDSSGSGGSGSGSTGSCSSSAPSGGRQDATVEALITVAQAGATIKTKDITTLANSTMKQLLKRGDVTLVMEYTYKGVDYTITIPAGAAEDNDIPWYGPLYLAGKYGNGVNIDKADKTDKTDKTADTTYVAKRGDTMKKIAELSGMSLVELAAKNPQIKNLNRIRVGQQINR